MTDFGPWINIHNGERPAWLADGEWIRYERLDGPDGVTNLDVLLWDLFKMTRIRVRADHPYYTKQCPPPTTDELKPAIIKAVMADRWEVAETLCKMAGEV
jgi:hypothetical protein